MPRRSARLTLHLLPSSCAALAILLAAPGHPASRQEDLAAAEAAAKAAAGTPEGRKFEETMGQAFGKEHSVTIQRCARETKGRDLKDFALFLKVDGAGVVERALVEPETALSACVESRMKGWQAPAPPHPGHWVRVSVLLKGK